MLPSLNHFVDAPFEVSLKLYCVYKSMKLLFTTTYTTTALKYHLSLHRLSQALNGLRLTIAQSIAQ